MPSPTASRAARLRAAAGAIAVLGVCACFLLAGCSSASPSAAPAPGTAQHAAMSGPGVTGAPAVAPSAAAGQPRLTGLAASQSIIYTASLTVRAADVRAAASRAAGLATAAGGYVSSESTRANHAHPAQATVFIQLKIPVAS